MGKISDNIKKYKEPTKDEHDKIAGFLVENHFPEEIRKQTSYFDENGVEIVLSKSERNILSRYLEEIMEDRGFGLEFRKTCEALGYKGNSMTNVSRLTKVINFFLKELSRNNNIEPPIQLFFYHKCSNGRIVKSYQCHLACAEMDKQKNGRRYSYNIATLEEAKNRNEQKAISIPQITTRIQQGPKYFRNIKDVLRWDDKNIEAEWFRKTGPIAADFQAGYIYQRKELLDNLHEHISGNNISILKGDGGTGKSVLIRNYAFNLLEKDENAQIYHYSFKSDPAIADFHDFLHVLNEIPGLIIIEDIHLAVTHIQSAIDGLKKEGNDKILMTTHSCVSDETLSCRTNILKELPILNIDESTSEEDECVDDFEGLVNFYLSHKSISKTAARNMESAILGTCEGNFWLLSYALKGHRDEGELVDWIKDSVLEDLRDIANPDFHNCNPEILIALSPLYMNEVLTSQSFLIRELGFKRTDIEKLVKIGEVLKHEIDGSIFYGLPHSRLRNIFSVNFLFV